jgi:adenylate cyclase
VNILNQYLTEMSSIIMDHMGTIDKYEGDAIMAFYGAPVMDPKNAYNACFAAILMQRRLRNLRENVWQKEGKPQLRVRMGINSGNMRVGNMGSKQRMDYTIMGDNVNLASRLEGVNKFYKTEIIVSQFTYEKVKNDFLFRELDSVRVVGKAEAIKIYELLDLPETQDSNRQRVLELYYQGKKFYRQKDFVEAKKQFKDALEINPDDGPSLVFLDRCQKFIKDPKSYTSVFSLSSK